jgi:hypothetical protein
VCDATTQTTHDDDGTYTVAKWDLQNTFNWCMSCIKTDEPARKSGFRAPELMRIGASGVSPPTGPPVAKLRLISPVGLRRNAMPIGHSLAIACPS